MLKDMTRRVYAKPNNIDKGYTFREALADGVTGEAVVIRPMTNQKNITIKIMCGANSGKVQYTLSPDAMVVAGTADWSDWEKGTVSGTEIDVAIGPITGLRGVSVSGAIDWEACV